MRKIVRGNAMSWLLGVAIAVAAATPGCKRAREDDSAKDAPRRPPAEPATRAPPPRVAPFDGVAFARGPGHLDGGLVFASIRASRVLTFLQTLPLPPELVRDLAEAGSALGMDLRVDDVASRLGLDPNAIITMTLVRPLDRDVESVRAELARGGGLLEALGHGEEKTIPAAPVVPTAFGADPPAPPKPIGLPIEVEPVAPPSLSPEAIAAAEELRRKASGWGIHMRFHVPTTNPRVIPDLVEAGLPRRAKTSWAALCGAVPAATSCIGENDVVAIFRPGTDALVVDVIAYAVDADPDTATRIAAAHEAALAPESSLGALGSLAGDAAAYVDAEMLQRTARLAAVVSAWDAVHWSSGSIREETVRSRLERLESIDRQRDAPMLFDGVALEATVSELHVAARLRWTVADGQAELVRSLLQGPNVFAPVPTLAALCDDALACVRTRGLPSPTALGEKLATGLYAESPRDFERTWAQGQEWSVLQTFASSWPNVLGAMSRWPAQYGGAGPERAQLMSAVDAIGRLEGVGGSLRRIAPEPRRFGDVEVAAYLRARKEEVEAARGLAKLAGMPSTSKTIDGTSGTVDVFEMQDFWHVATRIDDTRVVTEAGPALFGWVAVFDDDARYRWLDTLPRETNDAPSAYVEVRDLWPLLSLDGHLRDDLAFAQTWLGGRRLRAQLSADDGVPVVTAEIVSD